MFKRVIIWGHPLHSHTQSYVHAGYARGFKHLGYDVKWLSGGPASAVGLDLDGALVLTEGQVDQHLPAHAGATYVLHNCNAAKYLATTDRVLGLQVWTRDAMGHAGEDFAPAVKHCPGDGLGTIFQPWAAYLLPHEISDDVVYRWRDPISVWVGTIGGGEFGNEGELVGWRSACARAQMPFLHVEGISFDEERDLTRRALLAPAITGRWQREVRLLPCRAWKVASHGHVVATNSEAVRDIFEGLAVYAEDTFTLFDLVMGTTEDRERMRATAAFVREKHTYLNRCRAILRALGRD